MIVATKNTVDFYAVLFRRGTPAYAAFDLLWKNGRDLRPLAYIKRKQQLKTLLSHQRRIAYVHRYRDARIFARAAQLDLEGIVAKRAKDPYDTSTQWLKVKHPEYSQLQGRYEIFDRRH